MSNGKENSTARIIRQQENDALSNNINMRNSNNNNNINSSSSSQNEQ